MTVPIKLSRINSASKASCSSSKPGAMPSFAIGTAKMLITIANEAVTKNATFATRENRSHAAARSLVVRYSVSNGMNAIANAPPEINANKTSGKLFAALNVSSKCTSSAYLVVMMRVR